MWERCCGKSKTNTLPCHVSSLTLPRLPPHAVQECAGVRASGGMPAYQARRAAMEPAVHWVAREGGRLERGGTSDMFGALP